MEYLSSQNSNDKALKSAIFHPPTTYGTRYTIDLSLYQIFIYASRRRSTLIRHSVSPCVALIKFSRHTVKSCANQAPVHIIKKKYNASEQGIYTNMHAQLAMYLMKFKSLNKMNKKHQSHVCIYLLFNCDFKNAIDFIFYS